MDSLFTQEGPALIRRFDTEILRIEPWGPSALRVRATHLARLPDQDWALLPPMASGLDEKAHGVKIKIEGERASFINGGIEARIDEKGVISFFNDTGRLLLREYSRMWDSLDMPCAIRLGPREFIPNIGGDYRLTARFEAFPGERFYGMGQYQQDRLNLKGCRLELAHRNSQSSVPFALSSRGYGILWNNPAIGEAIFAEHGTEWRAQSTKALDYWIVAGDTPAEIEEAYSGATGRAPMMPDFGTGFWQCKLRYRTQEELLEAAREHKRRGLPLSVIVVDFFHWKKQGDWDYDPDYWPDPAGMAKELKAMGVELMVSIWPTIEQGSRHYQEMLRRGFLMRVERGVRVTMQFCGDTLFYDPTNPGARDYLWKAAKRSYFDTGARLFWLDEAEPDLSAIDFDNYRYWLGSGLEVGNAYPLFHAQAFYDGMREEGMEAPMNLVRCAWAGSQRFGAAVWSGDVHSSFASMARQLKAGLNMAIAGIPWWTSDIGGFFGGDMASPSFHELVARWFQYGAFCPIMRLHGDRMPMKEPLKAGGLEYHSGADNEVWHHGAEVYGICKKYMLLRERLRPYIAKAMAAAHERGQPPMRPLFYDFPEDRAAWEVEDQFLFGPDILVAPVLEEGARTRRLYLPAGAAWLDAWSGYKETGGAWIDCEAPLERIPLFLREGGSLEPSLFRD